MNKILDRDVIAQNIKDILANFDTSCMSVTHKKGIYIYGPPGCGKTHFPSDRHDAFMSCGIMCRVESLFIFFKKEKMRALLTGSCGGCWVGGRDQGRRTWEKAGKCAVRSCGCFGVVIRLVSDKTKLL
jgi:hypothetical protein